jgi:1,4-dihydroxy-2-naphthoyl-CoA synthase
MAEGGLVRFENVDGIGVITIDNPPVNALSPGVPEGIVENVERGNANPAIQAMVLIGAGRSFIAGADIRQFGTNRPPPVQGRRPHQILDASAKPVVAAIHGYALGGGLEIALSAHYRIAVPSAKIRHAHENDGDRRGRFFRGLSGVRCNCNKYIGLLPNQLSRERGKPLETATLMTVLNDNVLSFNVTEV